MTSSGRPGSPTFLVVLGIAIRFPLGLFNNLLLGQQRFDLQNLANFLSTALYALLVALLVPRGGGLILLGALTLVTTLLRLVLPLAWLRSELPGLRLSRLHVTRQRIRELTSFSWSNFLVHLANTVVFSTDVVIVGIVLGSKAAALYAIPAKLFSLAYGLGSVGTRLLYPALSEYEGSREIDRQRRLLLTGLRGVTAATLLLALPLLFLPGQLIEAWVGEGYAESSAVMALLALVALVHQPIYLLTQFLIARARQQQIARALVLAAMANAVLSVVLALTVGIWGVALATLLVDLALLVYVLPALAAPAAATRAVDLVRAMLRPLPPALAAGVVVLLGVGHIGDLDTRLELLPVGCLWALVCGVAVWRFGFNREERAIVARQVLRPPAAAVE